MVGWLYIQSMHQKLEDDKKKAAAKPAPKPRPITPKKKPRRKKGKV